MLKELCCCPDLEVVEVELRKLFCTVLKHLVGAAKHPVAGRWWWWFRLAPVEEVEGLLQSRVDVLRGLVGAPYPLLVAHLY